MKDPTSEYSRDVKIPWYDAGPGGTLKPGSAFRFAQETGERHLDTLGLGYSELMEKTGLVFIVISLKMEIARMPGYGEEIRISTRPRGRDRAQYYRDFRFFGKGDEPLLRVMQVTIFADAKTHRAQRVRDVSAFGAEAGRQTYPEELLERMKIPENLPLLGERKTRWSDLDANGHMDNAVYGDVAWDFLPENVRNAAGTVRLDLRGETAGGDTLRVFGAGADGGYVLRGDNPAGVSFCCRVTPAAGKI